MVRKIRAETRDKLETYWAQNQTRHDKFLQSFVDEGMVNVDEDGGVSYADREQSSSSTDAYGRLTHPTVVVEPLPGGRKYNRAGPSTSAADTDYGNDVIDVEEDDLSDLNVTPGMKKWFRGSLQDKFASEIEASINMQLSPPRAKIPRTSGDPNSDPRDNLLPASTSRDKTLPSKPILVSSIPDLHASRSKRARVNKRPIERMQNPQPMRAGLRMVKREPMDPVVHDEPATSLSPGSADTSKLVHVMLTVEELKKFKRLVKNEPVSDDDDDQQRGGPPRPADPDTPKVLQEARRRKAQNPDPRRYSGLIRAVKRSQKDKPSWLPRREVSPSTSIPVVAKKKQVRKEQKPDSDMADQEYVLHPAPLNNKAVSRVIRCPPPPNKAGSSATETDDQPRVESSSLAHPNKISKPIGGVNLASLKRNFNKAKEDMTWEIEKEYLLRPDKNEASVRVVDMSKPASSGSWLIDMGSDD